ncbi:MAG: LLM class flavin-dependent oxidoreductase [Chloroflexota bacterium]
MKIRIGVGLGAAVASDSATLAATVQALEELGFDSLWLSEVLTGVSVDPLAGLAFASGITLKLKLGTTITVTGRNPIRMAKELATIDRLSNGRLLLVFVPGLTDRFEDQALGVPVVERGAWIEEVLPLIRRLWAENEVTHTGPRFSYHGLSLPLRPVQQPLEVWLGGTARSALRRAGRLSDGWLPSLCTPQEAAAGRAAIDAAAAEAGRRLDPEHFGISLTYARDAISPAQAARVGKRRPGLEPATLIPIGMPNVREMLKRYIDVGFSKFVVRPGDMPEAWPTELQHLAEAVLPLQT